jgi:hypothetical protein
MGIMYVISKIYYHFSKVKIIDKCFFVVIFICNNKLLVIEIKIGRQLPLHITIACSSLWQSGSVTLGSPHHIPSPHDWAEGRLQAETLYDMVLQLKIKKVRREKILFLCNNIVIQID